MTKVRNWVMAHWLFCWYAGWAAVTISGALLLAALLQHA